ncbi:blos-9, partial [Pristionchus pacificus]
SSGSTTIWNRPKSAIFIYGNSSLRMQSVRSKELDSRCRLLAERMTECALIVDHDPSLALYRLNEHITRSIPVIVNAKLKLSVSSIKMNHVQRDLENAIKVAQSIENCGTSIEKSSRLLEQCIHFKDGISASKLVPSRSLRLKK